MTYRSYYPNPSRIKELQRDQDISLQEAAKVDRKDHFKRQVYLVENMDDVQSFLHDLVNLVL